MRRFVISEWSMSPALQPGDRVLGCRIGPVRRGGVVLFPHPHRADFWLVKRVVGLAGEVVTIAGGAVSVDGRPLDEAWTVEATHPAGEWAVPPGRVFVLSDARGRTLADSRTLGPVLTAGCYRLVLRYRRAPRPT